MEAFLSRTRVSVAKRILAKNASTHRIKLQSEGEESRPHTCRSPGRAHLPFALSMDPLGSGARSDASLRRCNLDDGLLAGCCQPGPGFARSHLYRGFSRSMFLCCRCFILVQRIVYLTGSPKVM